ncbi:MAG: NAD(P)-binding domain-containing protein [Alphaproteobacteria bacterium]|nr:NAD(P)-binding domain-containing protein [Alphaproteobacteria bacterium]
MKIALLGSGSWATAIAKILNDNDVNLNWWIRRQEIIDSLKTQNHNPHYLSQVYFKMSKIHLFDNLTTCIRDSDVIIIVVPSTYIEAVFSNIEPDVFKNKIIVSAVKGILPYKNYLLNEYLHEKFNVDISNYYTLLGPSHAEEVASKLVTYLTVTGTKIVQANKIAALFKNDTIYTRTNNNVKEVQYAAILKNVYALGAGIVDGLGYGDNFISSYIANSSKEMDEWLKYLQHHTSKHYHLLQSVFLGDLLVTCYSLHSRNRRFGKYIGRGYDVASAKLELNMVAEGYNAIKCLRLKYAADIQMFPIAKEIYAILWEQKNAKESFKKIESLLV